MDGSAAALTLALNVDPASQEARQNIIDTPRVNAAVCNGASSMVCYISEKGNLEDLRH